MTDTPIFDIVGNRFRREPAITGDEFITADVSGRVEGELREWMNRKRVELAVLLAPYGLHPDDIVQPIYRRFVSVDEVTTFGIWEKES